MVHPPHRRMRRASSGTRSPVGVPLRLLRRGSRPFGATPGQASWDVAGALDPERFTQPGAKDLALLNGRYPRPPVPVQGSTSQTGPSADQHDARSCPGADCMVPHAGTALAPLSGVRLAKCVPSMSEILQLVTELGTIVKRASLYKRQKSLMQTGRPQGRHDLPMHSEIKNQRSSPARPFLLASVRHALSFGRL